MAKVHCASERPRIPISWRSTYSWRHGTHSAPGIAKKRRSSAAVSRDDVSKTLVSRLPPQKRQASAESVSLAGSVACSSMARAWKRPEVRSIGGTGPGEWYPGSTCGTTSDQPDDLRGMAPEPLEAVELAFLGCEEV